jgi:hypothetical protein
MAVWPDTCTDADVEIGQGADEREHISIAKCISLTE